LEKLEWNIRLFLSFGFFGMSVLVIFAILLCLFLFSGCPTEVSAADAAKFVDGYTMLQQSRLSGQFEVSVCPSLSVVKCQSRTTHLTFLFRPKDDTITVLNERSKQYWSAASASWKPPFSKASYFKRSEYGDLHITTTEQLVWLGVPSTKVNYKTGLVFREPPVGKDERLTMVSAEVYATKALVGDFKSMSAPIGLVYGVLQAPGFPLTIKFKTRKLSERVDLDTINLKHGRFSKSEFEIPADYKRVTKLEAIYGSESYGIEDMREIMQGL
jgi:hypothetical protein